MPDLTARFVQASSENKRYLMDYSLQMATGEVVSTIVPTVTSPTDSAPVLSFAITGVAIAPDGQHAAFYAGGGLDLNIYDVKFIATTSLGQRFEDDVEYVIRNSLGQPD
jgi:hypothetical protein